ncbi:hypothetical protein EAO70_07870 [Streptomyces sp. adm13(2018)]|nr:hypothetical protein EAO70_07870 [Streptomyces sp. adm13(2018)]
MLPLDRIRQLLLELDEPRHLERPSDFDLDTSRDCFAWLVSALEGRFGPSCTSDLAQDASFYGVIDVPAEVTGLGGRPLRAAMSHFGTYLVTARVVEDESAPSSDTALTPELMGWLDDVCSAVGCTFVPAELLRELYDGPSFLEAHRDRELIAALVAAGELTDCEGDDESEVGVAYWNDRYFAYM